MLRIPHEQMRPAILVEPDPMVREAAVLEVGAVPTALQPPLERLPRVEITLGKVLGGGPVLDPGIVQAIEGILAPEVRVVEVASPRHVFAVPLSHGRDAIVPDQGRAADRGTAPVDELRQLDDIPALLAP